MKTAKIPVFGTIAVFGNIAFSVYNIDYTLKGLAYICPVYSPL